jgi:hypothetical protein
MLDVLSLPSLFMGIFAVRMALLHDTCITHTAFACNTHLRVYKSAGDILGGLCVYLCSIRDNAGPIGTFPRPWKMLYEQWEQLADISVYRSLTRSTAVTDTRPMTCHGESSHVYSCATPLSQFIFTVQHLTLKPVVGHTGMILIQLSYYVPFMRLNHISVLSIMMMMIIIIIVICLLYLFFVQNIPTFIIASN